MTAHSSHRNSGRFSGGRRRIAPRAAVAALAVIAVVGVASGTAFAGGKTTGATSDIWFASVDGAKVASSTSTVKFGDTVDFGTTVGAIAGYEYPMVAVTCFQDVNGDGVISTVISGPDIVYSQLEKPGVTMTMGGYSSIWTLRGGGAAICKAELDAYGWKSGKESIRVLKTLPFSAQG